MSFLEKNGVSGDKKRGDSSRVKKIAFQSGFLLAVFSALFSQSAFANTTLDGFIGNFEATFKAAFSILLLLSAAWGLYKIIMALIDLTKPAGQSKNTGGENAKDIVIGVLAVVVGVLITIIINTGGLTDDAFELGYSPVEQQTIALEELTLVQSINPSLIG